MERLADEPMHAHRPALRSDASVKHDLLVSAVGGLRKDASGEWVNEGPNARPRNDDLA